VTHPVRRGAQAFAWPTLAAAAVVGIYAVIFAPQISCVGDCQIVSRAQTLGWTSAGAAALQLALVATLVSERRRRPRAAVGIARALRWAAFLAAAGVIVATYRSHLAQTVVSSPLQLSAPTTQLPLTLTAVGLCAVGSLVVLFAAHAEETSRPRVTLAGAVGTVVAIVAVVSALGVTAVTIRSQRSMIDVATAEAVPVPPPPIVLGKNLFRVRTGPQQIAREQPAQTVLAAGAGFVVLDDSTSALTAFDATGAARWHYRRHGGLRVGHISAYDNGATLLVALINPARTYGDPDYAAVLGVDALTGALLWTSTDENLVGAATTKDRTPFLVYRGGKSWTAFDPRTGLRRWSISNPLPCPDDYPNFADTTERIVALSSCNPDGRDWRVTSVDPSSGSVTGTIALPFPPGPRLSAPLLTFTPAGDSGVFYEFTGFDEVARRDVTVRRYINASTMAMVDMPLGRIPRIHSAGGDPLVQTRAGTALLNADGTARCTFAAGSGPLDADSIMGSQVATVAWAPQTVAYLTFSGHHYVLHTARRSDCHQTGSVDLDVNWAFEVLALPGIFAAFIDDSDPHAPNSLDGSGYVIGLG
jgi:outer membrane protein assembly factor BamB